MKYLLSSDNSGDIISVVISCWTQLVSQDLVHIPLIAHKDDVTSYISALNLSWFKSTIQIIEHFNMDSFNGLSPWDWYDRPSR